jgi:hypothetical protein
LAREILKEERKRQRADGQAGHPSKYVLLLLHEQVAVGAGHIYRMAGHFLALAQDTNGIETKGAGWLATMSKRVVRPP